MLSTTPVLRGGSWIPRYNARVVSGTHIVYEIALPGFDKSEVSVSMSGSNSLVVSSDVQRPPHGDYIVHGVRVSPFSMSFPVPSGSEVESAKLTNGILTVTIAQQSTQSIPITD